MLIDVVSLAWQCFIDERFDASANINNYEVLYFDEKIDEIIHNKATPFLMDTTFKHKPSDTYIVPIPVPRECAPYISFPVSIDCSLFSSIEIRETPVLVSEDDLNQERSMHISWMSVEFFKQKKLYDRSVMCPFANASDTFLVLT